MPFSPLHFKDALGNIERALIDSARRVVITGDPAGVAVPVVSTNADKLIGYSAGIATTIVQASTGATITITSAAVPAGTLWVIDQVEADDASRPATSVDIHVVNGANVYHLPFNQTLSFNNPAVLGTPLVLSPGEKLECVIGTTNGDSCALHFHGYSSHST